MSLTNENQDVKVPWWFNEESSRMLNGGYLLRGENLDGALERITSAAAKRLKRPDLKEKFKEIVWNGWMSLSSPIWANMGTQRGLPISCVEPDTWINTEFGGKRAKDIEIGDRVLTHKGRFKPVSNIMISKNKEPIWKLKVDTRTTDLFITGNHPVLTNLGWVRVDELEKGVHMVAINRNINEVEEKDYTIDLKPFVGYKFVIQEGLICKSIENKSAKSARRNKTTTHITYFSSPKEFVEVTEELAWAIGLWFAEGSISTSNKKQPNGIRITLNTRDKDIGDRWLKIITEAFNLNGGYYVSNVERKSGKKSSWINYNVNSSVIGNLFNSFGLGCKNKLLPEWIMTLPKNHLSNVLRGVIDGDGWYSKVENSEKITLANPKLILQLYQIALRLGRKVSLKLDNKASYKSKITGKETIPHHLNIKLSNEGLRKFWGVDFEDGLTYCPIKELTKTDRESDVYDFTVEEDHSFSCNGIVVHNCFGVNVPDSLNLISDKLKEVTMQTKIGGGTSGYFGNIRERGAKIKDNGESSGPVPFMQIFDTTMGVVSQGS